jgi:hypothetical protein
MHMMPYLIKNPAGTWCVQRKVPEKLQAAVPRILGGKKPTLPQEMTGNEGPSRG